MLNKLWQNNRALALLAGAANVLAFAPICLWPFIYLTPALLFIAVSRCKTAKEALLCGYLCSLVIMLGGFYWVVYVIHVFGYLPWWIASLGFLIFCGFGALNFPIFAWVAYRLHKPFKRHPSNFLNGAWFLIFLPALFTVTEWTIPKLFPWAIGNTYYFLPLFIQISEITGASILSFSTAVAGGLLALQWTTPQGLPWDKRWVTLPLALWIGILGFGWLRLSETPVPTKKLNLGLVQANVGSLERLEASQGSVSLIQQILDRYRRLSEQSLSTTPTPDLLIWPETAMPFLLDVDYGYAATLKQSVREWGKPLITGAYSQVRNQAFSGDYNAAVLLTPGTDGKLATQIYEKNILLAFGEYFPLGHIFPVLYRWFPQVSNFRWGTEQKIFVLENGTRIGMTVCYEAIVPTFVRKVAQNGIQVLVNLTNDSWFGPTSEPYQHAALSVFRAVETRVPLIRVTNTGTTLTIDRYGRMGERTPIYQPAFINAEVEYAEAPSTTVFIQWGNWFVYLLFLVGAVLLLMPRKPRG